MPGVSDMGLLRTKPLTPQHEAQRQVEIANEIQRQRDAEAGPIVI